MIDHIALAIGHGLLAIALLRLFVREDLNVDPLLDGFKAASLARRRARREARREAVRQSGASDPHERR